MVVTIQRIPRGDPTANLDRLIDLAALIDRVREVVMIRIEFLCNLGFFPSLVQPARTRGKLQRHCVVDDL